MMEARLLIYAAVGRGDAPLLEEGSGYGTNSANMCSEEERGSVSLGSWIIGSEVQGLYSRSATLDIKVGYLGNGYYSVRFQGKGRAGRWSLSNKINNQCGVDTGVRHLQPQTSSSSLLQFTSGPAIGNIARGMNLPSILTARTHTKSIPYHQLLVALRKGLKTVCHYFLGFLFWLFAVFPV